MTVCPRCARFGTSEWTPSKPRSPAKKTRPRSEVEAAESLELVEDYGTKIRKARQSMKMTVEELGMKIGEKTSVIKKLEKEELTPDRRLVSKLRNALRIDLLFAGNAQPAPRLVQPSRGRTIGDIIRLRQGSEETSSDVGAEQE